MWYVTGKGADIGYTLTYGVGGGLFALLVLPVVSSDCAMSCLTLHCLPIRTHQHTGHHTQAAIAWGEGEREGGEGGREGGEGGREGREGGREGGEGGRGGREGGRGGRGGREGEGREGRREGR